MAIKGLKGVLGSLKKFGKEADKSIEVITYTVAKDIEVMAKQLAPVDMGFLRNQIYSAEIDPKHYKIVSPVKYSPFMEFGTGGLVSVPDELKEIAIQFKGKGVKQINITPRPFMYPSWKQGQKDYVKELNKELDYLTKKYN